MSSVILTAEDTDYTEMLTTPAGPQLYYREWRTDAAALRGAVLLVHGYGEHLERYGRLARQWNASGFAVGGCDLRGFGRSEGIRTLVKDYSEYCDDVSAAESRLRRSLPVDTPLYLYAHSMGGLISLLYSDWYPEQPIAGLVLSGPLIGVGLKVPAWQLAFGRLMNRLNPTFCMTAPINPKVLTHDPKEQIKLASDPLFPRKVTLSWFFATEKALTDVQSVAPRMVWPTCWLIPGEERIVSTEASRAFFSRLPDLGSHTWQEYPGLFHELHNESRADRDRVARDVGAWMISQL